MSESDYQRGLRGGDFRAYGDDQAWKDWEDGQRDRETAQRNAERIYEAEQDARDEALYVSALTPAEKIAYYDKKIKERKEREAAEAYALSHPPPPSPCENCKKGFVFEAILLSFPWTLVLTPLWLWIYFSNRETLREVPFLFLVFGFYVVTLFFVNTIMRWWHKIEDH